MYDQQTRRYGRLEMSRVEQSAKMERRLVVKLCLLMAAKRPAGNGWRESNGASSHVFAARYPGACGSDGSRSRVDGRVIFRDEQVGREGRSEDGNCGLENRKRRGWPGPCVSHSAAVSTSPLVLFFTIFLSG